MVSASPPRPAPCRTVSWVPTKVRTVNVAFYTVEPAPTFEPSRTTFLAGHLPWEDLWATVRLRDAAAEDYRLKDHLWGGETLCLLHDNGPEPILGAYYKDNFGKLLTEYKGEVTEATLREGEGPVMSAYLASFPMDVVGLVRTSSKAPGFASIGRWITAVGGISCALTSLPDANTLQQLRAEPTKLNRFTLGALKRALPGIQEGSPSVAKALDGALSINPLGGYAGLDVRAGKGAEVATFSAQVLQEMQEVMAVLPDLEEAKVYVSGRRRPINLKRSQIVAPVPVVLQDTTRVGLKEAAEALFTAYAQEHASIEAAVKALPYR